MAESRKTVTIVGDSFAGQAFATGDAVNVAARLEHAAALLDLQFSILCLDHGRPFTDDPQTAIRELLDRG